MMTLADFTINRQRPSPCQVQTSLNVRATKQKKAEKVESLVHVKQQRPQPLAEIQGNHAWQSEAMTAAVLTDEEWHAC